MKITVDQASTIIEALRSGNTPTGYTHYYTVGRKDLLNQLIRSFRVAASGGSAVRVISGEYGSGKSHILDLTQQAAVNSGFAVMTVTLDQEHLLRGSDRRGVATFNMLMSSLALPPIDKPLHIDAASKQGLTAIVQALARANVSSDFWESCADAVSDITDGVSIIGVLMTWVDQIVRGFSMQDILKTRQYFTGTVSRAYWKNDPVVSAVPTEANWHNMLFAVGLFLRHMGYRGLIIIFDEVASIFKVPSRKVREQNYDKFFTIYNALTSQNIAGIFAIFSCPARMITDQSRGFASIPEIQDRLESGSMITPLEPLTQSDYSDLIKAVSMIYQVSEGIVPEWETRAKEYLSKLYSRYNADIFITPRDVIQGWINVLDSELNGSGVKDFSMKHDQVDPEAYSDEFDKMFADICVSSDDE